LPVYRAPRDQQIDELPGVEYVARSGVDNHAVLARPARHGENDFPAKRKRGTPGKPDQTGLDVMAERSGRENGRPCRKLGKGRHDLRFEIGEIKRRSLQGAAELVLLAEERLPDRCGMLGRGKSSLLRAEQRLDGRVLRYVEGAAGRALDLAGRCEPDGLGGKEDGNALELLPKVDRHGAGAGAARPRIGLELGGQAGESLK